MTAQADFSAAIPDIADPRYEATREEGVGDAVNGLMPGPPLRTGLSEFVPPGQLNGSPFPNNASPAVTSLKGNRKIVTNILRYLVNRKDLATLRVCRMWSKWAAGILWYKPDLPSDASLQNMVYTLESPSTTFAYSQLIRRLNFTSPRLSVSYSTLTTLSRCKFLERLHLNKREQLTSAALEATLKSWPNILFIDLTGVFEVTNEAIISLTETSNKLRGINLNGCKIPGDPVLIALAKNCPDLCRLKMGGSELVTDVGISAVVKGCPLLSDLDVQGCSNVTDIAVRAIWTQSHNMQELRLALCNTLTDLAFPSNCEDDDQKDDSDDLWGLGERGVLAVVSAKEVVNTDPPQSISEGKKVESTDPQEPVSSLPGLTFAGLYPLVIHQQLRSLRFLDLSHCKRITDVAIEGVIACAPKLRSLVLTRCSLLTDRSVEAICKLGRSLHYLDLTHVEQITDESVKKLARSCKKLKYVDFASCTNLTDESVVALCSLPNLRRVGFVKVSKITDAVVYALAQRRSSIERVHLSHCTQITVEAIHTLLERAYSLTLLSLTGIPCVMNSPLELQKFCREPPEEFDSVQRSNFRVYSGKGLAELRWYLYKLMGGSNFNEQELSNTIGDAPPVVGDARGDSDHYEFEADV